MDIKAYSQESLRDNFGVAFQDFRCFAFTLTENILFKTSEKISQEDMEHVSKAETVQTQSSYYL